MGKYKELIGSDCGGIVPSTTGNKDLSCHVTDNGDSSNTGRYIWGLPVLIFYQATGKYYRHIYPCHICTYMAVLTAYKICE